MILRLILTLTVLASAITVVSGLVHLRKHRHPMSPAREEPTVVSAMHQHRQQAAQQQDGDHGNISSNRQAELHNFRHDDACGQATLSCMAFVHDQVGMPVRCGMLKNAPVCLDAEHECTAFCDEDG
ncbi:hypothetical protein BDB00DRAFT_491960 [Zychaea mexicana]|uniref:uncharacterized protein n=1 Tax=Zychaea mexicana TaxID=64656 RepID=UPI0022FE8A40|nr:uncharacterized protein BDB00DRAFT_491960 [Zychaea mexicana]KAI9491334.1 hypothetical protein BDB00DRAFT_491960 [Zychaea mexicana]